MSKQYPHLFVVTCNSQPWAYADYMWSIFHNILSYKGPIQVHRADFPRSRVRNNRAIKTFLESDAEVMVKMDLDQEYPQDFFNIMAPLALQYKVIGPEIYDRWEGNNFSILCFEDKYDVNSWIDCSNNTGIQAYPYTHTNNFYAREVLESVLPPWYDSKITADGCNKASHTDYDFLDKIKRAGYKIYLNHSIEVNHLFIGKSNREFSEMWQEKRGKYGFNSQPISSR